METRTRQESDAASCRTAQECDGAFPTTSIDVVPDVAITRTAQFADDLSSHGAASPEALGDTSGSETSIDNGSPVASRYPATPTSSQRIDRNAAATEDKVSTAKSHGASQPKSKWRSGKPYYQDNKTTEPAAWSIGNHMETHLRRDQYCRETAQISANRDVHDDNSASSHIQPPQGMHHVDARIGPLSSNAMHMRHVSNFGPTPIQMVPADTVQYAHGRFTPPTVLDSRRNRLCL